MAVVFKGLLLTLPSSPPLPSPPLPSPSCRHLRECGIRELQSRTFWRVVRRLATLYLDGNNFGDNGLAGNAFLGLRLNTL